MRYGYKHPKYTPLTKDEMKKKYEDIKDEMKEVLKWKKETEANLKDENISPQKRGAAKRAMKKIKRRIDTVKGQTIYWEMRLKGESHFKANLEKNEYWAKCKEKNNSKFKSKKEKKKIKIELPEILKKHGIKK